MKNTRGWQVAIVFCALLLSAVAVANTRDYQDGKLVDVSYDNVLHSGSSQRHALYEVRLGDVIYSAEGDKVKSKNDPAHGLIVGDNVRVALDGNHMYLRRPDGKDIKTVIVKRERAQGFFSRLFSKK
jgi:hypothetical protein